MERIGLLVVAGLVAGTVATAGGIASLVSYPALLLAGLPPLPADVANLIAFVVCGPGSSLTSRRELRTMGTALRRGVPVAAGGAVVGAFLLVVTPPGAFGHVAPFLVLAAGAGLALQPWLTGHRDRHPRLARLTWPSIGAVGIYAGYFGAGSGILLLTAALIFVDARLPQANALKNILVGATAIAAAGVLVLTAPVEWWAVVPLAIGALGGSTLGPLVARRVPVTVLRWTLVALSVALAVELWLHPG
ncbi:sulfite exporter TauE/SafE family protein [Actinomycetospora endophytica]|uniref:Probable membrane transporter protein n=1 Tax=Actinomycetospora endophytica TaxID=2291215 RepID=A0ABS8P1N7_9PSEU|nr:sulfite exporter TauE/SafE family protein [Actinomycetospora endophytica]MCD2192166.1 sulfite exporter TauE/SafE family protein [Actinomycetospora endophytica]